MCCWSFLDFSKAFDCVNHDILLSKLESFNVKGLSLQIIASFLRGCHQFVSLNGTLSLTLPIKVGVPQGSVLAPTQFNFTITKKPLQETNETELLGFTICKSLTWKSHVENIISLVDKKICFLRLCRRFLTTFSSKQFYYQFIHCHVIQGIQIHYSLSPKYLRDN